MNVSNFRHFDVGFPPTVTSSKCYKKFLRDSWDFQKNYLIKTCVLMPWTWTKLKKQGYFMQKCTLKLPVLSKLPFLLFQLMGKYKCFRFPPKNVLQHSLLQKRNKKVWKILMGKLLLRRETKGQFWTKPSFNLKWNSPKCWDGLSSQQLWTSLSRTMSTPTIILHKWPN